ncbi:hypothetical protein [uncultured Nitrospira sp.]|uniref:hypothetical protein n=1 Tax=uncultured Nitrospira sp. TaxID=157176 RepID=UPI0031401536
MKRQNTFVGLIHSTILTFAIGFGSAAFVLANDPADTSPTMQEEQGTSTDAGEVQERGISRMPFGGATGGKTGGVMDPVGFSCDAKSQTCTCKKSKTGDCKLMKSIVCSGTLNCPGSSQTCTCTAIR